MKDAVIIGAGLAGLSCARQLTEAGLSVQLMEAGDAVGGRVRTDIVDGFRLDRGFQVLLTAYPEAQRQLDYKRLRLKTFSPGALVWHGGRFHRFADPFRTPLQAMQTLSDPIIPLIDKLRVPLMRGRTRMGSVEDLFRRPECRSRDYLSQTGFSDRMIERFFSPFFGGVFLETELNTSSRWLEFLFRMFAEGSTAVPGQGMQRIPEQMAAHLPDGVLRLSAPVARIRTAAGGRPATWIVVLEDGEEIEARALILAVNGSQAQALIANSTLLAKHIPAATNVAWNATTCFYFAAEQNPIEEPIVILNGEGRAAGPVNNASVISNVSPGYAAPGSHLVSASVVGSVRHGDSAQGELAADVRAHLAKWFGPGARQWRLLATYPIAQALPQLRTVGLLREPETIAPGVIACGDFCETPSIQGALVSGAKAAQKALAFLA